MNIFIKTFRPSPGVKLILHSCSNYWATGLYSCRSIGLQVSTWQLQLYWATGLYSYSYIGLQVSTAIDLLGYRSLQLQLYWATGLYSYRYIGLQVSTATDILGYRSLQLQIYWATWVLEKQTKYILKSSILDVYQSWSLKTANIDRNYSKTRLKWKLIN